MKKEHYIIEIVDQAKTDSILADELIKQYLPFIKSEASKFLGRFITDDQDELSIAMFAFYETILAYQEKRGSFLKLASLNIKNRLIDYQRKERRHMGHISMETPMDDDNKNELKDTLVDKHDALTSSQERSLTKKEIEEFSAQLTEFGLSLSDISDNCPKQDRTLAACMHALDYARSNPMLLEQLIATKKLPVAQIVAGTGIERKTLERHRKYLVAIMLAYTNGYEIIRGHLRMIKRKEGQ